jgi:hypothetical protein
MKKRIYEIFFEVVEKSRKCKNLCETSALIKEAVEKLKQDGFINNVEDEEQQKKAFLAYCISRYGKEKSRFSVVDRSGVEFHCGNVMYDGQIFFVVSANGKIVECLPIED